MTDWKSRNAFEDRERQRLQEQPHDLPRWNFDDTPASDTPSTTRWRFNEGDWQYPSGQDAMIKTSQLKRYLRNWVKTEGFITSNELPDDDISDTLSAAMTCTQRLQEWNLIRPDQYACEADYSETAGTDYLHELYHELYYNRDKDCYVTPPQTKPSASWPKPDGSTTADKGNTMSNTSNLFGNMPGANKFMDRLFKKADNIVWDLMTGRVGIQTADGIATLEGDGDDAQITINLMDQFGMGIPAFAQSTPISSVNVGDIIFFGAKDAPGWVIEKKGNIVTTPGTPAKRGSKGVPAVAATEPTVTITSPKFVLMKVDGTRSTWTPPKVSMLGMDSGVMVLRSLMSMLPGGQAGLQGMQSMLMPMLMMGQIGGDGDGGMGDMEAMIPMMLMGQLQATPVTSADGTVVAAPNPMMQMMPMMAALTMMKKMNGGGDGGSNTGGKRNPFDNR